MGIESAFLDSVANLLLLADIAAALAVIFFFAKFVVELADSALRSRVRNVHGGVPVRRRYAARVVKRG